ncbi:MAG: DUF4395 domain-containing protein [Sulfurovum sp.]|nr:DUF4395 domain-containing protein [Sulfurovum sp.]MCB4749778.1 DUF4395 domain-containing protein [Sulfurovum sp.]MCB4758817.1 DUF4395 domain-containing protein [Sulfurovum sp.]MCB4764854.1 DUF4395 domain-containing protein [Sulfurovum sp.]MCB4765659.1 DUF4395 domain-containing protein [Sulfurovum sp.]
MLLSKQYGETVSGYETGVLNDREVRAAAGIMFMLGMIVIFVGIGFNHAIVARVYLTLVFFDLTIRIITPRYSPFLLLGRFFVQNQKPEYVGAVQKRFAWILGWIIFLPMMNWFVLHWEVTFYRVLLCKFCLGIIFFESAFGICVGCKLYALFSRKEAQYCPGGVCEIRTKDPIQTFSFSQKIIATTMFIGILIGTYLFIAKTDSRTFFGEFLHELVLTEEQLEAEIEAKIEAELNAEEDDF